MVPDVANVFRVVQEFKVQGFKRILWLLVGRSQRLFGWLMSLSGMVEIPRPFDPSAKLRTS